MGQGYTVSSVFIEHDAAPVVGGNVWVEWACEVVGTAMGHQVRDLVPTTVMVVAFGNRGSSKGTEV